MALYTLAPQPWLIFLDDSGIYLPSGQLAIYVSGTMTPATVYTSANGTAHPFPITLDSAGRVPGGLYLQPGLSYKFVLHEPQIEEPLDGGIIKTQEPIDAVPRSGGSVLALVTAGDYPTLNVGGVDIIEYTGAGDVTIRGMVGGTVGQSILIRNLSPTATVWLSPEDAAAPPGAQLRNFFINGMTPLLGERSSARYTYISTGLWVLEGHAMGRPITPPFSAGDYWAATPGVTWTVEPGDIISETFYLNGRNLIYAFRILNTVVAGGVTHALLRRLPFGWRASGIFFLNGIVVNPAGAAYESGAALLGSVTDYSFERLPVVTNWISASGVIVYGQLTITLE